MGRSRIRVVLLGIALVAVLSVVAGGPQGGVDPASPSADARTTLTVVDGDGTELGSIEATTADTYSEKWTGLSETASLAENQGMVFVYEQSAERTYVMRNMSFPLDMLFVAGNGTITTIHHAAVDAEGGFSGEARWVIEVNRGWSTEHGVSVGDRVEGLPR